MALNKRENRRGTSMKRRFSARKGGTTISSASTITCGVDGNVFTVSGTTDMNYLTTTGWQAGSRVTFLTTGASKFKHNTGTVPTGTGAFLNNSGADITNADLKSVSYIFNGTAWVQD